METNYRTQGTIPAFSFTHALVANVSRGDVGLTLANVGATLETDVGQRRHDNAHLLRADIGSQHRSPTLARHRTTVGFISIAGPFIIGSQCTDDIDFSDYFIVVPMW